MYKKIISLDNLYLAARNTVCSKRKKTDISNFLLNLEMNIERIREELENHSYKHGGYKVFYIKDPKFRAISKAEVRDRVVHHAVHDVIYPNVDNSFIYHSYACRIGKGTHKAIKQAQTHCRTYKYYMHLDIVKYFNSINRDKLKELIKKHIKDENVLWLLNLIIDSSSSIKEYKNIGLPLGNLTSQFFANVYLNEIDQFVKHKLRIRPYIRYMDDLLLFGNMKKDLLNSSYSIKNYLNKKLYLDIHKKDLQPFHVSNGVKYLGFKIYPFYKKVLPKSINRFRGRLKKLKTDYENGDITLPKVSESIRSSISFFDFGDTDYIKKELLSEFKLCK